MRKFARMYRFAEFKMNMKEEISLKCSRRKNYSLDFYLKLFTLNNRMKIKQILRIKFALYSILCLEARFETKSLPKLPKTKPLGVENAFQWHIRWCHMKSTTWARRERWTRPTFRMRCPRTACIRSISPMCCPTWRRLSSRRARPRLPPTRHFRRSSCSTTLSSTMPASSTQSQRASSTRSATRRRVGRSNSYFRISSNP